MRRSREKTGGVVGRPISSMQSPRSDVSFSLSIEIVKLRAASLRRLVFLAVAWGLERAKLSHPSL